MKKSISNENITESILLLSNKIIEKLSKEYNYIYLSLVQVVVKPLIRKSLNTSLLVWLRDKRYNKFQDNLSRIIELILCTRPVYFKCFPNYSISLHDPHIKETLSLNLQDSRV